MSYILGKPIIAIDFDGTLTNGDTRKWENNICVTCDLFIPNEEVINWVKSHRKDYYFILWSCRCDKYLENAVNWCKDLGIVFDAVNKNLVTFKTSNKIIADYYIDDKAINVLNFLV